MIGWLDGSSADQNGIGSAISTSVISRTNPHRLQDADPMNVFFCISPIQVEAYGT